MQCKSFAIDLTWGPTPSDNIFTRNAILTNGQFPAPPLTLNQGECVDFTATNNMPNVTGIHFHGIRQLATPWSDGVPGVSQNTIKQGETWNYRWTAEESGIYFYHSHYKGQMMDGLFGAIIIQPSADTVRPFSLISQLRSDIQKMMAAEASVETVLVSDWNRFTFNEYFAIQQNANIDDVCGDTFILNGIGSQYCLDAATLATNAAPQVPQILNGSSLTAKGCIPAGNAVLQAPYPLELSSLPATAYDVCTPFSAATNYTYVVNPSNGWAAMSFISPSGLAQFTITIDGHKLYVYEINGNYVEPQSVDTISVYNGDRISFMLKLDQPPADYTIRVANNGINQVISGFGIVSYKGSQGPSSATPVINYGGFNSTPIIELDRFNAPPYPALSSEYAVSQTVGKTYNLVMEKAPTEDYSWAWVMTGDQPYNQTMDDDVPPFLFERPSAIPQSELILRSDYNEWIDIIMVIPGPLAEPHTIHKHANKFFVVGSGTGSFNYTTTAAAQAAGIPINLNNPAYVDGYTNLPAENTNSWMIFRYQANTPGAWLLHCHIQTHLSGGMAVAVLEGVDYWPTVPSDVGLLCNRSGGGASSSTTASPASSSSSPTAPLMSPPVSKPSSPPSSLSTSAPSINWSPASATTASSASSGSWSTWKA